MADHQLTPHQIDFLRKFIGIDLSEGQGGDIPVAENPLFDDEVTGANPLYEETDSEGGEDKDGPKTGAKSASSKSEDKSSDAKTEPEPQEKAAPKDKVEAVDPKAQDKGTGPKDKVEAVKPEEQKTDTEPKDTADTGEVKKPAEKPKPVLDMKRLAEPQTKKLSALKQKHPGVHDALVDALAQVGGTKPLGRADHAKAAKESLTALEARQKAQDVVNAATNAVTKAEAELAALNKEKKPDKGKVTDAERDVQLAKDAKDKAELELKTHKKALEAERKQLQLVADQRVLIDQISTRTQAAKAPLDPEDAKRLIGAFAKAPAAVMTALAEIDKVPEKERKAFIAHVETAVTALDALVPGPEKAEMAANAVMMGARGGAAYRDGFDAYYKSDRAKAEDPTGGMDAPLEDAKAEAERRATVGKKRAAMMAQAVIVAPTGKEKGVSIDIGGAAAKDALADLQFHPGALKTFTPSLTSEMLAMAKTCLDQKAEVEKRLNTCTAPATQGASALVRNALALKDTDAVDTARAQQAVMSAMFTPIAQGAVGSCASTAPLVAAKTNAPLDVMDRLVEIASEGTFTPKGGDRIPANTAFAKDSGNDLSRSLEFSVATASANLDNSGEMAALRQVVTGSESSSVPSWVPLLGSKGEGLLSVSSVDWAKSDAKQTPKAAIARAVSRHLRVAYDAETEIKTEDGSSTKGGHKLHFIPDPDTDRMTVEIIDSEEKFKEAMVKIALKTGKLDADSKDGKKVASEVRGAKFSTEVTGRTEPFKPWDIGRAAGYYDKTSKVFSGDEISQNNFLEPSKAKASDGARVTKLLGDVMTKFADTKTAMTPLSTFGKGAQHGFNFLKDAPGQDLVTGKNSVATFAKSAGESVTKTKLSAEKADETYFAIAQRALEGWGNLDPKALETFMSKPPGKEMTQKELHAYAKVRLKPVIDAMIKKRAANAAAKPGETKKLDVLEKEEAAKLAGAFDGEINTVMLAANPPDFVTLADTNWGGPEQRVFFVVAPDPGSGELALWKRGEPDGTMRSADSFALAQWQNWIPGKAK